MISEEVWFFEGKKKELKKYCTFYVIMRLVEEIQTVIILVDRKVLMFAE